MAHPRWLTAAILALVFATTTLGARPVEEPIELDVMTTPDLVLKLLARISHRK